MLSADAPLRDILAALGAPTHLARARADLLLTQRFKSQKEGGNGAENSDNEELFAFAKEHIEGSAGDKGGDEGWEAVFGGLGAAGAVLAFHDDVEMATLVLEHSERLLGHAEVRVRARAGEILAHVARVLGSEAVLGGGGTESEGQKEEQNGADKHSHSLRAALFSAIDRDFAREETNDEEEEGKEAPDTEGKKTNLKHDTEGWRTLETSFKALQSIMRGGAATFGPLIDDNLVSLLVRSGDHKNRFVRESGYFAIGMLCAIAAPTDKARQDAIDEAGQPGEMPGTSRTPVPMVETAFPGGPGSGSGSNSGSSSGGVIGDNAEMADSERSDASSSSSSETPAHRATRFADVAATIVPAVARGLADNWSQVRFSACVAARQFLVAYAGLPHSDSDSDADADSDSDSGDAKKGSRALRESWECQLVPPLCLNRYYGAEGVRLYSQNTWVQVFGSRGRGLVERYMNNVVDFYTQCAAADNHSVREAACACIAELASGKVDLKLVETHAKRLLETLVVAFRDESWPVRDAACLASADFVSSFPVRVKSDADWAPAVEELWVLWTDHLADNIWSVREDSAVALGRVMRALGNSAQDRVLATTAGFLRKAKTQSADGGDAKFSGLSDAPAVFSVAAQRHARVNDVALHSDQQAFSCGSLAPKLKAGGGCSDHSFRRPAQAWEHSDGAIYMLRELARVAPEKGVLLLPILADIGELDVDDAGAPRPVFHNFVSLLETLLKQLPDIIEHVGAGACQGPLAARFVRVALRALARDHRPTVSAAGFCLEELAKLCGADGVEACLTDDDRELLQRKSRFVRYPFVVPS
jgi:hypothetical protein